MQAQADRLDAGADLSQRFGVVVDVAPLDGLAGGVHEPALVRDAGTADGAERVEEDFGGGRAWA